MQRRCHLSLCVQALCGSRGGRRVGLKISRDCDDRILERRNGDNSAAGATRTFRFRLFAFLITAAPGVQLERSATFYAPTIKLSIASSPPRPRTCKRVNSHPPKFNHQLVRRLSRKIRTALSRRRFCGASAATLVAGAPNLPLLILKKGLKQ
jgi:hypothetical protein